MLATLAISVLTLALLAMLAGGIALTVRQFAFVAQAYRVQGTVVSEWHYELRGRQRFYRVEFQLRNGQRAELRGSGFRPLVGQPVPVLVRERPGHGPKAQIDAWEELWLVPTTCLAMGALGTMFMAWVIVTPGI
ncbi:DUF3592 domain-containing protein [Roseateles sp. LYH14W]|uniref:DUF3592 domain-containing protein n=1 Tax=Pelomonas parva TaxID=3299032 RepID=A0ABW7F0L1_9BURK